MPSREPSELSSTHLHFLSPAQRFCAKACVSFITCVRTELYEIGLFRFLFPSFFMDIVVNVDGTQCTSSLLQQGLEAVVRCFRSGGLPSSCAVHMCLHHAIPNSSYSSWREYAAVVVSSCSSRVSHEQGHFILWMPVSPNSPLGYMSITFHATGNVFVKSFLESGIIIWFL